MTVFDVKSLLTRDEGREHAAYADPLTHAEPYTCGIGCTGPDVTKDTYWDDATIDAKYQIKVNEATDACNRVPGFVGLNLARRAVLIAMAYQMGGAGLLAFHHMLTAVAHGDWATARHEMLDSTWAKQTPERAGRMAAQMFSGEWIQA